MMDFYSFQAFLCEQVYVGDNKQSNHLTNVIQGDVKS